jgi:hypothetical protein
MEAIDAILSSREPPISTPDGGGETEVELDPDLLQPSVKHYGDASDDDIEIEDEEDILSQVKTNDSEDEIEGNSDGGGAEGSDGDSSSDSSSDSKSSSKSDSQDSDDSDSDDESKDSDDSYEDTSDDDNKADDKSSSEADDEETDGWDDEDSDSLEADEDEDDSEKDFDDEDFDEDEETYSYNTETEEWIFETTNLNNEEAYSDNFIRSYFAKSVIKYLSKIFKLSYEDAKSLLPSNEDTNNYMKRLSCHTLLSTLQNSKTTSSSIKQILEILEKSNTKFNYRFFITPEFQLLNAKYLEYHNNISLALSNEALAIKSNKTVHLLKFKLNEDLKTIIEIETTKEDLQSFNNRYFGTGDAFENELLVFNI